MSDKERLEMLEQENQEMRESLLDIWTLLFDYGGHYDSMTKKGDPHELAHLIDRVMHRINMPNKALDKMVEIDEELGLYDDFISEEME